jgi:hypothetical protein
MLNLFNKKKTNLKRNIDTYDILDNKVTLIPKTQITEKSNQLQYQSKIEKIRHYPPATKEWFNSIYVYNKEYIKSLLHNDSIINNLIYKVFNLDKKPYFKNKKPYFKKRKLNIKKHLKNKRYTVKYKIFVSRADFKHTNKKVLITLYTYNNLRKRFEKNLRKKNFYYLKFNYKLFYKYLLALRLFSKIKNKKQKESYVFEYIKKFLKKKKQIFYSKVMLYLILKKKLVIIRYRFERFFFNIYGYNLIDLIKHIYDKEIEFKIINLKLKHLNSDILSHFIVLKLKNRKNKLLKVLNKSIRKVKILSRHLYLISNNDIDIFKDNVLNYIKHKAISGVRLEARGRLTRRLTASRSIFKFKYKGSLKNIDSSYKKQSSVILRGHVKSNLQYTIINSKTRNGAFGLKSWISSY